MNKISLHFTPTIKDTTEAALGFLYEKSFMKFCLYSMKGMVAVMLVTFLWLNQKVKVNIEHAVFLIGALLFTFFSRKINYLFLYRRFSKEKENIKAVTVVFDESDITVTFAENPERHIDWEKIKSVKVIKAGWVICFKAKQFLFIPSEVLADKEDKRNLEELFSRKKVAFT